MPRIIIAGVSSGSGKTTVCTGLIGALRRKNYRVRPYKAGPDYIDTGYLENSAGKEAINLDIWLMGKDNLVKSFVENFEGSDIAVIEGVMGLFDGGDQSTAEISKCLKIPVLLCIDSEKIGESVGAIVKGFTGLDPEVAIMGVILTKVSGPSHYGLLKASIKKYTSVPVLGYLQKDNRLKINERHLGLKTVYEEDAAVQFIESAASAVEKNLDIDKIIGISERAPVLGRKYFGKKDERIRKYKAEGIEIAYSHDDAFNFFYHENLKIMENMGAVCRPFSPLKDKMIEPGADLIIIWGGFPESFAPEISRNKKLHKNIRQLIDGGKPVYAECGGLIYLSRNLIIDKNRKYPMVGALPVDIKMGDKLEGFGYKEAETRFETMMGPTKTKVRGHEFHHSVECGKVSEKTRPYDVRCRFRGKDAVLGGHVYKNVFASYLHLHFSGNREALKNIFDFIIMNKQG